MKLYAPHYYKNFKCIADRCRHSCCIGWEIDIDAESTKGYASLSEGYGEVIRASMEGEPPHFRLCADGRCPHLAESGLCNIITELGEGCLCDICREHPRFYNYANGRAEVGLGMACEEACRLILTGDFSVEEVGECADAPLYEFPTCKLREELYAVLAEEAIPYRERLERCYALTGISPACLSDGEWRDILASLEYLNNAHGEAFACYTRNAEVPPMLEGVLLRALAYFIYRHASEAEDETEHRASLGFCFFLERLLASLFAEKSVETAEEAAEWARILSEELEYSEDNTEALKFEISMFI